ncbi:MAG: synthase protein [Frankiaceae bacterium]|nr:synthase protein [Frankiaceae bacterium]
MRTRLRRGAAVHPSPLGLSLGSGTAGALGVGVGGIAVSALAAGGHGALSAVAGLVVVLLFFGVSLYVVEVANRVSPSLTLPVGVTVYSTLVLWLGVLALGTSLPDRLQPDAFAWTVVAATLGWLVAQATAVWRSKAPYVDVELPRAASSPDDVV